VEYWVKQVDYKAHEHEKQVLCARILICFY